MRKASIILIITLFAALVYLSDTADAANCCEINGVCSGSAGSGSSAACKDLCGSSTTCTHVYYYSRECCNGKCQTSCGTQQCSGTCKYLECSKYANCQSASGSCSSGNYCCSGSCTTQTKCQDMANHFCMSSCTGSNCQESSGGDGGNYGCGAGMKCCYGSGCGQTNCGKEGESCCSGNNCNTGLKCCSGKCRKPENCESCTCSGKIGSPYKDPQYGCVQAYGCSGCPDAATCKTKCSSCDQAYSNSKCLDKLSDSSCTTPTTYCDDLGSPYKCMSNCEGTPCAPDYTYICKDSSKKCCKGSGCSTGANKCTLYGYSCCAECEPGTEKDYAGCPTQNPKCCTKCKSVTPPEACKAGYECRESYTKCFDYCNSIGENMDYTSYTQDCKSGSTTGKFCCKCTGSSSDNDCTKAGGKCCASCTTSKSGYDYACAQTDPQNPKCCVTCAGVVDDCEAKGGECCDIGSCRSPKTGGCSGGGVCCIAGSCQSTQNDCTKNNGECCDACQIGKELTSYKSACSGQKCCEKGQCVSRCEASVSIDKTDACINGIPIFATTKVDGKLQDVDTATLDIKIEGHWRRFGFADDSSAGIYSPREPIYIEDIEGEIEVKFTAKFKSTQCGGVTREAFDSYEVEDCDSEGCPEPTDPLTKLTKRCTCGIATCNRDYCCLDKDGNKICTGDEDDCKGKNCKIDLENEQKGCFCEVGKLCDDYCCLLKDTNTKACVTDKSKCEKDICGKDETVDEANCVCGSELCTKDKYCCGDDKGTRCVDKEEDCGKDVKDCSQWQIGNCAYYGCEWCSDNRVCSLKCKCQDHEDKINCEGDKSGKCEWCEENDVCAAKGECDKKKGDNIAYFESSDNCESFKDALPNDKIPRCKYLWLGSNDESLEEKCTQDKLCSFVHKIDGETACSADKVAVKDLFCLSTESQHCNAYQFTEGGKDEHTISLKIKDSSGSVLVDESINIKEDTDKKCEDDDDDDDDDDEECEPGDECKKGDCAGICDKNNECVKTDSNCGDDDDDDKCEPGDECKVGGCEGICKADKSCQKKDSNCDDTDKECTPGDECKDADGCKGICKFDKKTCVKTDSSCISKCNPGYECTKDTCPGICDKNNECIKLDSTCGNTVCTQAGASCKDKNGCEGICAQNKDCVKINPNCPETAECANGDKSYDVAKLGYAYSKAYLWTSGAAKVCSKEITGTKIWSNLPWVETGKVSNIQSGTLLIWRCCYRTSECDNLLGKKTTSDWTCGWQKASV